MLLATGFLRHTGCSRELSPYLISYFGPEIIYHFSHSFSLENTEPSIKCLTHIFNKMFNAYVGVYIYIYMYKFMREEREEGTEEERQPST